MSNIIQERKEKVIVDKVVTKELDLTQLLLKIKEIETLKKILLTKEQKLVFNYQNVIDWRYYSYFSCQKLLNACEILKNSQNDLNVRMLKLLDMGNIDVKSNKKEKSLIFTPVSSHQKKNNFILKPVT